LIKEISKKENVDESQVHVDYIFTKRGLAESIAKVKILKEKPKIKKEGESEAQASQAA